MLSRSLLLTLAAVLLAAEASAQTPPLPPNAPQVVAQSDATQFINMEVGQTRLLRFSDKVVRISVAEPNVADVRVVTPLQVLVTAKGVGYTHIILWSEADKPLVIAVSCARNLDQLRNQIKELFPKEKVAISAAGELVVLSGTVSDLRVPARVAEVAKLHSTQLANLLEVSGDQQVQLDVRFAEVSRSGMRRLGLNFLWQDGPRGYIGGITAAGAAAGTYLGVPGTGGGPPVVPIPAAGDAFNLFFSTGLADFPFSAILSVLAQEGLGKMLAEPTIVALSGQEAKFHAGGEVPVLVSQQLGTVSVQYKKFGVQLKFVPTVLGAKTMALQVAAEVSEPDPTKGVTLGGYQIPGFKTRSSETTVRLKDGQSFAVAGLLSDDVRTTIRKVPLLGELPILGALFRSTSFQREETELLVVVRARLVQPLTPDQTGPMPGELELNDLDDFQLFLLGRIDGDRRDDDEAQRDKRDKQRQGAAAEEPRQPTAKKQGQGGPLGPIGFVRR